MYQMYAYQKKYEAKQVFLLYPMTADFLGKNENIMFESKDGTIVKILFIDLLDIDKCIKQVVKMVWENQLNKYGGYIVNLSI